MDLAYLSAGMRYSSRYSLVVQSSVFDNVFRVCALISGIAGSTEIYFVVLLQYVLLLLKQMIVSEN